MIPDIEIRQRARSDDVEPVIVERDYVLGWLLAGCSQLSAGKKVCVFKGGTCLRKCYFSDYRFSEDLDFTLTARLSLGDVEAMLREAARWAEEASGIRFTERTIRSQVLLEGTSQETYRFKFYYRGPHRQLGDPSSIKVDLTYNERILLPPLERPLDHPYSDKEDQGQVSILCYTLEEVLVEKVRGVSGQRLYPISRDPFDIDQLIKRGVDLARASEILIEKCGLKGVKIEAVSTQALSDRKNVFKVDWENNLSYLLPAHLRIPFEESWQGMLNGVESLRRRISLQ